MKTKNQEVIRALALTAALGALTIVLTITRLGFIPWFSGAAITILHVPVIIATLLGGLWAGLGVGLVFGLSSLIQAAVGPTGVLDPFFVNPIVSVLPRMLIALITFFVFKALQSMNKNNSPFLKQGFVGIAAFLGSLTNTVFVIGALYATHYADLVAITEGAGYIAFLIMLLPQALLEAGASVVLSIAVVSLYDVSGRKKSKLEQEIE
ncbi:MAG: ECF transporter S component, partial [Spirochaetota bacterium]|nr:ECF transporter S component [Spirochaetota bacterium]HUH43996.1 ECF transporter S component [Treponemataceae bacterium]